MTDDEIRSLREWLEHWGDGPNWSDATGQTIPISKTTLRQILDEVDRRGADIRRARQEAPR